MGLLVSRFTGMSLKLWSRAGLHEAIATRVIVIFTVLCILQVEASLKLGLRSRCSLQPQLVLC